MLFITFIFSLSLIDAFDAPAISSLSVADAAVISAALRHA